MYTARVYICIRAIRSPETGSSLGMGDKVVGTLITWYSMLGAIPNPKWTGKSITPTVATDPQSVKRGEKQDISEPNRETPASR